MAGTLLSPSAVGSLRPKAQKYVAVSEIAAGEFAMYRLLKLLPFAVFIVGLGLWPAVAQDSPAPGNNQPASSHHSSKNKNAACNTDCAHLCLSKGDTLPAMIGNDGMMFRLPNGTWCTVARH